MVANRTKLKELPVHLSSVTIGFETFDAFTAENMASSTRNVEANFRKSAKPWLDQIVSLMGSGDWHLSPCPIVIDEEGNVVDGLHRLTAQGQTGKPWTWLVVRGWPNSLDGGIDRGKNRNVQQWLSRHHPDWKVTTRAVATIRSAVLGTRVKLFGLKLTDSDFERAFMSCKPLLMAVENGLKSGVGLSGSVRGAFLRAAHYCEMEDLIPAMQIASSGSRDGIQQERDKSMIALKNFLGQRKYKSTFIHHEEYIKTESALISYLNGKVVKSLRGSELEQFPVDLFDSMLSE